MTKEYYQAHKKEVAEQQKLYHQTESYKISRKKTYAKYDNSEKGLAKRKRYFNSDKFKAVCKKHDDKRRQTEAWKIKSRAQHAVAYAVKMGSITKCPCLVCGDTKSFAHHHKGYDTANIFNIVWLCRKHHNEAHKVKL